MSTTLNLKSEKFDTGVSSKPTIKWEQNTITLPFDDSKRDQVLFDLFQNLQKKVTFLEKELIKKDSQKNEYVKKNISDSEARALVVDFLKDKKSKGTHDVSLIDITSKLFLPAIQVERILESLQNEHVIGVD